MKKIKVSLITIALTLTSTSYGGSITESADSTKSSNAMGQLLNVAMGAANLGMAKACAASCGSGGCCPMAPVYFLMGMQNLMQAAAQGNTAGQAGGAVGLTDTGFGTSGYDPNAVNALKNDPEVKAGTDFIATVSKGGAGFTYDPKTGTVTTASGKTLKGSDVNSAGAMESAGIPKSVIDVIGNVEKDIAAKAAKKIGKLSFASTSSEEAGGGSGGSSASTSSNDDSSASNAIAHPSGLGIDRDPAQVAGMQKNFNGEPIGVAGDSIFKMMTRRYKTKEAQSSFLDESELLIQK